MAASNGSFPETLTEGWISWLPNKEVKKSGFSESSSGWKSLYFYMSSSGGTADITLYKKPTKSKKDKPTEVHSYAQFQLHKKTGSNKHQPYICEVIDKYKASTYYAFENEGRRDAFAFFLMTQRRLPEQITTGKLFVVKPADSDDHRRIGSRGSVCLLHVCQSGLSIAFEISQSIVAQWPLNCIRNFGTPGLNQFQVEAGRRSPMGEGIYTFHTKSKENELIYKQVDRCIQHAMEGTQSMSKDDKIYDEYCSLSVLARNQSHSRYSRDLQRISANNFRLGPTVLSVAEGNRNSSNTWSTDNMMPETKLSDVENWLETSAAPRKSSVDSHAPLLREGSKAMLPGMQKAMQKDKPPVPDSSRPSWNRPPNGFRQRSKTEDPLSLPSLPETPGYLEMHTSMHSLNVVPGGAGVVNNRKHPALSRSDRQLGQLSMSSVSVSRSFDGLESGTPGRRSRLSSQSSSVLSPSMKSLQSLGLSTVSLATPPPSFYEAMALPGYVAPTPPEDAVSRSSRLSSQSSPATGSNVLSLPKRKRKQQRGKRGSIGSCEDLTALVRNSLSFLPNDGTDEYENAMFNNELMHNFEISGDHSRSEGPAASIDNSMPSLSTDKYSSSGGETEIQSVSDRSDTVELRVKGDSNPTAGAQLSEESNRITSGPMQYNLAGEIISSPPNSEGSLSPRVISTYLLERQDITVPPGDNQKVIVRMPDILPTDRYDSPISPYVTTILGPDTNHYIAREMAGPPPIPDIPRPYQLKKQNSVDESSVGSNNQSTSQLTTDSSQRVLPTVQSGESHLSRALPQPNAAGCRDTVNYEEIGDNKNASSLSSTGTSSIASQVGLYEPVNEKSMLENQLAETESTTVWHVSLDDEPIDNPLHSEMPGSEDKDLSQAVENFQKIQAEAATIDPEFKDSQWTEDPHGYLLPAESPPSAVRLPLPPSESPLSAVRLPLPPAESPLSAVRLPLPPAEAPLSAVRLPLPPAESPPSAVRLPLPPSHDLLPAESPLSAVRLPLPPSHDSEDSEDEKPRSRLALGYIRKLFSERSRGRLRRTKSADILGDGASAGPSAQSTRSKLSSKKSKSKSSNKVNGELDFITVSAKTREFTRDQ